MATPDLSTLTSASQIFTTASYTLPQIRAIHKQLHNAIDDKSARLRTQVGGSYRELLGTADRIVKMRSDVDRLQLLLEDLGTRCGRQVVTGKAEGLSGFERSLDEQEEVDTKESHTAGIVGQNGPEVRIAALFKLLDGCLLSAGHLLRSRSKPEQAKDNTSGPDAKNILLVAAKVLTLGRLLVSTLHGVFRAASENSGDFDSNLDLRKSFLVRQRHALLHRIYHVLRSIDDTDGRGTAIDALCAYAVINNCGPQHTVRHFLHVRSKAMSAAFNQGKDRQDHTKSTDDVVRAIKLFTSTLLDVQHLVPQRLAAAMAQATKHDLVADQSLRNLHTLRLDNLGVWCGRHVRCYRITLKNPETNGKAIKEMLSAWYEEGIVRILDGLTSVLARTMDVATIVDTRTNILQLWIQDGGHARGFDAMAVLQKLSSIINTQIARLLTDKANKLHLVGSEVASSIGAWQAGVNGRHTDLWELEGRDIGLNAGATSFAREITARLYGRNDITLRAGTSFKTWVQMIEDINDELEALGKQRWDNDVDDIEAEETIEERREMLSKKDPSNLRAHFRAALGQALQNLDAKLRDVWQGCSDTADGKDIATYLLRVTRDIRINTPPFIEHSNVGQSLVPELHQKLVEQLVPPLADAFAAGFLTRTRVAGRALWEGDQELPVSPSSGVLELLRSMTLAMDNVGLDLWTPSAVRLLKNQLAARITRSWEAMVESRLQARIPASSAGAPSADDIPRPEGGMTGDTRLVSEKEDGGVEAAEEENNHKDLVAQWLFDSILLDLYFGSLGGLTSALWKASNFKETSLRERLQRSAQEYYKRSSLLFGLLV